MAAPTVSSITINSFGLDLEVTFDQAVIETDADGWTLTVDGEARSLRYKEGSGTTKVVFSILDGRPVDKHDVCSYAYDDGTGDAQNAGAEALATIATAAVTNGSGVSTEVNAISSGESNKVPRDVPADAPVILLTESTEFFTVWDDTETASDDSDNPFSETDGEGFSFAVPNAFCGWFALRHKRVYNGTETLTAPVVRVFGKKGNEWYALPDSTGAYDVTIDGDRINYDPTGISNDAAVITEEHLFDMRGADEIRVLVETAYANGAATTKEAILQGRFFTFS